MSDERQEDKSRASGDEMSFGFEPAPTPVAKVAASPYRVLARKYRPSSFEDLIGQEPMVQTFRNAFKYNRVHQAYILTGVRGVGKTTTARILARAFNYACLLYTSVQEPQLRPSAGSTLNWAGSSWLLSKESPKGKEAFRWAAEP